MFDIEQNLYAFDFHLQKLTVIFFILSLLLNKTNSSTKKADSESEPAHLILLKKSFYYEYA